MDYAVQFQKLCQVETRRLLFVTGIIFAVVLVLQSSALPYRNVISSLVPAAKFLVPGKRSSRTGDLSPKSVMVGNVTLLNDSNSTNSYAAFVVGNDTDASHMGKETKHENKTKGKDTDHGFALEEGRDPNDAFELDKDRKPENGSAFEKVVALGKTSPLDSVANPDNGSIIEKAIVPEHDPLEQVRKSDDIFTLHNDQKEATGLTLEKVGSTDGFASPRLILPTSNDIALLRKLDANSSTSDIFVTSNISSVGKQATETQSKDKSPEQLEVGWVTLNNNASSTSNPIVRNMRIPPTSISKMNILLLQSRVSTVSMRSRSSSVRDRELLYAKSQIENAPITWNDPELYASVFRNVSMFKRSYELMEHILKVYIYREGEKPIFHQPELKGIYASEGWFMKLMEGDKQFIVKDPRKAHLFYLPFSSKMLRLTLYERNSHNQKDLALYLNNYVDMIAEKYHFWNRTGGLDHFLVACHDWAPRETRQHMGNCIRALCNTNVLSGFKIGKDVSLPVTYMRTDRMVENPLRDLGGKPPSERPILAFFAGNLHGYLRPILLKYWENKDPDMKISGPMSRDVKGKRDYVQHMKSSKYCISARGYEVHTPRVVEAIFYECVPVIISDNYVPPFFEVLNWEAFSVFVPEKDIPNLKNILLSIPEEKYREMQLRVKKVQQHFLWHKKPVKYDLFHMTLHSIWYNRVFQIIPR